MGHTILLADDSITIQKVIELTFSDEDFELHTVGNGQKAIEEIRAVKPDIVLCDIIMPEKNGYEVCEFIKTNDDLKHIPVLLLTGAFEPFDQERAKKAGCDGFLAKPFEPQTLISKVKELLAAAGAPTTGPAPVREKAPQVAAAAPMPAPPAPEPSPAPEPAPTVEMPPTGPTAQPPAPPQDEGATIMADSFAVEAGQRELAVESGDQTVLLGEDETPTVPSEDIWKAVQGVEGVPEAPVPPQPEAPVDEGATVFVPPAEAAPAGAGALAEPPAPSAEQGVGRAGFDDFAASVEPTPAPENDAWALPSPEEEAAPQPGEPELTPLGDFGGFDDFSAESEPAPPGPPATPGPVTPLSELPLSAEPGPSPEMSGAPEPIPVVEPQGAEEPLPALEPPPEPPPPSRAETLAAAAARPTPSARRPPAAPESGPPVAGAPETALGVQGQDLDALVDKIAEKVIAKLSDKVIKDLAWEVVPDLAETLIRREIEALKAKIPK